MFGRLVRQLVGRFVKDLVRVGTGVLKGDRSCNGPCDGNCDSTLVVAAGVVGTAAKFES